MSVSVRMLPNTSPGFLTSTRQFPISIHQLHHFEKSWSEENPYRGLFPAWASNPQILSVALPTGLTGQAYINRNAHGLQCIVTH